MKKFGDKIKELRIEKRISQRFLAKELNIAQQTLCCWENNQREPNLETLTLIAKFFNVSTDYLLGLKDY